MKNFTKMFLTACLITGFAFSLNAQSVGINTTGDAPNGSAMLDVSSTTKGFLPPRMTTVEIAGIPTPANGLMVYNTNDGKLYIYVSTSALWKEVTFGAGTISPPFVCGSTLTINHAASGNVAPVDKTVTYGTVSTPLFGGTKCTITRNLGATNQASSGEDPDEASAGWYWQFNHKQGYKHDGTTRTPNTTWITSIDENSNWTAENDPCTLELGAGWRIPTYTEWTAADENGSWGNYTNTYNSVLKLHAAGILYDGDGSLNYRGSNGFYWSSSQYSSANGWNLHFFFNSSGMNRYPKANGFSLRCLRD